MARKEELTPFVCNPCKKDNLLQKNKRKIIRISASANN